MSYALMRVRDTDAALQAQISALHRTDIALHRTDIALQRQINVLLDHTFLIPKKDQEPTP